MKIQVQLTSEVRDKHGQLKNFTRHEANSFPRYIVDQIYAFLSGAAYTNGGLDTGGSTRTLAFGPNPAMSALGAAGDATMGIVVGTGTNAVTIADRSLQTLIAHGTGAGQLSYGTVTFPQAPTVTGSTKNFTMQRTFTNNSAGSITVNEVGIYVNHSASAFKFCLDRTLDTKTVPVASTLTETYTIGVTV